MERCAMKLSEFTGFFRLKLSVDHVPGGRVRVYFQNAEIKKRSILTAVRGDGFSREEAVDDYVRKIRGRLLVINAYKKTRREIIVPKDLSF